MVLPSAVKVPESILLDPTFKLPEYSQLAPEILVATVPDGYICTLPKLPPDKVPVICPVIDELAPLVIVSLYVPVTVSPFWVRDIVICANPLPYPLGT